jgi:hypothetical protein
MTAYLLNEKEYGHFRDGYDQRDLRRGRSEDAELAATAPGGGNSAFPVRAVLVTQLGFPHPSDNLPQVTGMDKCAWALTLRRSPGWRCFHLALVGQYNIEAVAEASPTITLRMLVNSVEFFVTFPFNNCTAGDLATKIVDESNGAVTIDMVKVAGGSPYIFPRSIPYPEAIPVVDNDGNSLTYPGFWDIAIRAANVDMIFQDIEPGEDQETPYLTGVQITDRGDALTTTNLVKVRPAFPVLPITPYKAGCHVLLAWIPDTGYTIQAIEPREIHTVRVHPPTEDQPEVDI